METSMANKQSEQKADYIHAALNSLDNVRENLYCAMSISDAVESRIIMDAIKHNAKAAREVAFLRQNMR